jgi:hypothetical protein
MGVSLPRAVSVSSTRFLASTTTPAAATASTATTPMVVLKRNNQSKGFRNGNPLVFSRAIDKLTGPQPPNVGQLYVVAVPESTANDSQQQQQTKKSMALLGYGVYNPNSLYRVRILCHKYLQPRLFQQVTEILTSSSSDKQTAAIHCILEHHIRRAIQLRRACDLPNSHTTDTFRLLHGEGDGVSGLAVDIINNVAVVMSSAAWCQVHQECIMGVIKTELADALGCDQVVWKTTPSRLAQDGYSSVDTNDSTLINNSEDTLEDSDQVVLSKENGVLYETRPFALGQKTGTCESLLPDWRLGAFNTFYSCFSYTCILQFISTTYYQASIVINAKPAAVSPSFATKNEYWTCVVITEALLSTRLSIAMPRRQHSWTRVPMPLQHADAI